jgi:hypothetical protein
MDTQMIEEFLPILIIFTMLAYPKTTIKFSHSILGRFIAVSIIIFYSSLDKYLGLFVCGLVMFYYQTDYVEGMMAEINENFDNLVTSASSIDGSQIIHTTNDTLTTLLNNSYKQFTYYADLYKDQPKTPYVNNSEEAFKKENCDDEGNVIFKGSIIHLEMIEYLFPEIKFQKNKCNPCDNNCRYTIVEKKLATEEKMKPISTLQ